MIKKVVWLLMSCLMVLTLIISSCGGDEVEAPGDGDGDVVGATEPQYGGTITTAMTADYRSWDPTLAPDIFVGHMMYTHNEYIQGDWTKGPNGSGETDWEIGFLGRVDLLTGELAESWEMPDNETIVLHLVEGVHYHDKPPVNGRELTAEDAAWSIMMRFLTPGVWHNIAYPPETGLGPTSATAIDKYTVEVKVPTISQEIMLLEITENGYCNAPEIWEGDGPGEGEGMAEWQQVVGTGPFEINNYVTGSYAEYTKFDDYWEYDPMYPQNKWPYLDSFKVTIIADMSSQLAALRTGKIDFLSRVTWDSIKDIDITSPDIEYKGFPSPWEGVAAMRMDKPELPYYDLKVRQAMNMAVNQEELLEDYYEGDGAMLGYPFGPTPSYEPYFVPLEDMPEEVKMLYRYDPEGAKELLTEAGYPEGFKAVITCTSAQADYLSIIKEYLAAVNIDLELLVVEASAFNGLRSNREYEMIYMTAGIWAPFEMLNTKQSQGMCVRNTPDAYYDQVQECIASNIVSNPDKYIQCVKDAAVYELESAWGIWSPRPNQYNAWWPWVRDYNGIFWTGWAGVWDWTKSIWLDKDMKTSMGY
ncbi:MAG: ABC transporter substrate-binding protein [Dehalococcoidales bacterium]|nr:MAG: ABC transporter substrate-binding protein [Dehalococcoidales bacterium]